MKKIIALILLVVLSVSLLAGCEMGNAAKTETEWVLDCYARSYPHLIKVNSTQQFGGNVLNSETVLVRGSVGGDFVACMTVHGEQMRSIQDGSGKEVYGPIEELDSETWFRMNVGTSTDKVTWDPEGKNFFPAQGSFALPVNASYLKNAKYVGTQNDGTLTFTVAKADTAKFFGEDGKVDADVNVTVITGGGNVTAVEMSWTLPANTATGVETMTVSIKTQYNYTQQKISLD